jgi:single-stranded-DNA-specific exonuclease
LIRIFDGFTSASELVLYLVKTFPSIKLTWSNHLPDKKHGVNPELIPVETNLFILPDGGSNDYEIYEDLNNKGIDILILDHHEADSYSEHALTINPQLDDYPNKWISGAGVVYKFIQQIDKTLGLSFAEDYADLSAWGMVGDAMQLAPKETKWLVSNGLSNIQNEFFNELIKENVDEGVEVTPNVLSFKVNPKVNAYLRMATTEELDDLFKAFIGHQEITFNARLRKADKSETWARRITRICNNMYQKQRKLKEKLLEELSAKIEREKLHENSFIVVEIEGDFEMNMSGYIASFLVTKYRKPTLVLRKDEKDEKFLVGSMRGYDTLMIDTKDFLQGLNLFDFVEGHQGASGIRIGYDNFKLLDNAINQALYELDTDESHVVDLILPASNINKPFIIEMEKFSGVWGKGLEVPMYAIEQLEVNLGDAELIGKEQNIIKFNVNSIEFIKFSDIGTLLDLKLDNKTATLNVVGKTGLNSWRGNVTPQFVIEAIEIVEVKDSARFVF